MMQALYSAVGIMGGPLIRHWLGKRRARGKEDPARFEERFGHASQPRPPGPLIWLHAASVGEAQSVLTLVRALHAQQPATTLLVTTGTVTSAAMLAQQALPGVIHQYVPVDTYPAVRRFLNHWQPDLALWVESEFWPQLLHQTRARGIPMLLINARMSARSAANWQRLPRTAKRLLACFTAIYAGDHADAERLRALGAPTVIEAGNLKYDAASLPVDDAALASLRQQIGARPCWLAASTHANEEIMIGEVQHMLTRQLPETLCIIVPRHAVRGDSIAADLRAMGHRVAQRSKGEAITADTGIYLADTMGELGLFYSVAPCAFLGGSLIAHGGHNPLEPARLGCAVLSGPHTHNFASIVSAFVAADAIAIVPDKTALAAQLQAWLPAPEAAQAMAERARRVTAQHSGATAAILQRIAGLLP